MTDRPTPEEIMKSWSGYGFYDALKSYGYVIVHPDDVPTADEASAGFQLGWDSCRYHIFGDDR